MRKHLWKVLAAVLGVSLLFVVPTWVSAFDTQEDFHLSCDENQNVVVSGHFTNNDSSETLHVTATDNGSHIIVDLGNVAPGQSIDKSGSTGLKSVGPGSVTVKAANVSDESVSSSHTLTYGSFSCSTSPSPTASPDFNVAESVTLACTSDNNARFDILVTNNESFPVVVSAKIDKEQNPIDWGILAPGSSIPAAYGTTLQSVGNGTVHFTLTRADNASVYTTKDVTYTGVSCDKTTVTPTVTPTDASDNNSGSDSNDQSTDNTSGNNSDQQPLTTLPRTGTPFTDLLLLGSMLPAGIFLKKFAR